MADPVGHVRWLVLLLATSLGGCGQPTSDGGAPALGPLGPANEPPFGSLVSDSVGNTTFVLAAHEDPNLPECETPAASQCLDLPLVVRIDGESDRWVEAGGGGVWVQWNDRENNSVRAVVRDPDGNDLSTPFREISSLEGWLIWDGRIVADGEYTIHIVPDDVVNATIRVNAWVDPIENDLVWGPDARDRYD